MQRRPDEFDPAVRPGEARPGPSPRDEGRPPERTTEPARGRPWPAHPSHSPVPPEMHLRDEIDKIVPGPGHAQEVDERVRERMEEESPDGRPPTLHGRAMSRNLFIGTFVVVWLVVLGAVYWIGGIAMAALVLLLTAVYIGYAAWPTWRAALERRTDEQRAEREIETESHPAPPPDRQPPAQNR